MALAAHPAVRHSGPSSIRPVAAPGSEVESTASPVAAPARLRGLHIFVVRPLRGPAARWLFSVASAAAPAKRLRCQGP
jgi:hypothetical protein